MESPTSTTRMGARSSMIESFRGCGLSGLRIDKEELKKTISLPAYMRTAMVESINKKDLETLQHEGDGPTDIESPDTPLVVFVNSRSGGRYGPELKLRLQQLMGPEQAINHF